MRVLLLEARGSVGGTAGSEGFAGATVNICNCDHLTFRTTPVIEELNLANHGLRYLDVEPSQLNMTWDNSPAWPIFHNVDRTVDALHLLYPGEVEGYRNYLKATRAAVRLLLDAANDPPTFAGLGRKALKGRLRGLGTLFGWSRRSAADIIRSFFTAEALRAPGLLVGPMVWGISPELPGSGLGALTYALRHVATVGRPVGGSGAVPDALLRAFVDFGGSLRLNSPVTQIICDGVGVRAVALADGTEISAPIVVSACDPHSTFVKWLTGAPVQAADVVQRWTDAPHSQGYESKIDAVISMPPRYRSVDDRVASRLGFNPDICTAAIAPSLAEMHRGYQLMAPGHILPNPGLLANVPTALDPTMAPNQTHVLSLEALYTPYNFTGGWATNDEPQRWLDRYATLLEPGFFNTLGIWRAMTPAVYERDFHLPQGHAASFAGGPLAALHNANPELTKYETPVPGLFLTGAATFPGAGVWGASGRNTAMVVLRTHQV
jgi:beta-carotene ketolase (CrtO type)